MDIFDRFYPKVQMEPNSGCWIWDAGINAYGYGTFAGYSGETELAHRVSYEMHVGKIPPGMQIDHRCRLRCCVNPDHLEVVTKEENYRRGDAAYFHSSKTHCQRGHPYEGDNLYVAPSGARHCRTCANALKRFRRKFKAGWRGRYDRKTPLPR